MLLVAEHEQPLEASLIRGSGFSLRRFYRGRCSLGEVWRRMLAAPWDAPIWGVMTKLAEDQREADKLRTIDDTLAIVDPRWAERDTLNRAARTAEAGDDVEEA